MGLCKCPKRKVTNLFCFEHRVNVCESCLVTNHQKCIVQSYLQWLQDSDYSSDCPLCATPLAERETVRLVCYDVVHWGCLAARARALPPRTAPAGHRCPRCGGPVFPPPRLEGPVASALRARLETAAWARPGLGLPLIEGLEAEAAAAEEPWGELNAPEPSPEPSPSPAPDHVTLHVTAEAPPPQPGPRKALGGRWGQSPPDTEEDKYRRRTALSWLPPGLRCRARGPPRPPPPLALALGALLLLALLLLLLGALGRGAGPDPALELLNNPHVRVGH